MDREFAILFRIHSNRTSNTRPVLNVSDCGKSKVRVKLLTSGVDQLRREATATLGQDTKKKGDGRDGMG